jgi:hypothetical protein
MVAAAAPASAHGLGAAGTLPIPLWWVAYGAVAVLIFSFIALSQLWPEPRLEDAPDGTPLDGLGRVLDRLRPVGRLLGTLLLVITVVSALRGSDLPAYALYVAFWVGIPVVSAVLGDLWSFLNPFAAFAELLERADVGTAPGWLERAGRLPAAVLLLGFGWLELVHPQPADADVILGFLALYTVILLLGGLWWGREWVDQADGFGIYFALIGRLGVFARDGQGRLRLRRPLVGLAHVRPTRGTAAVVLVVLGVTSFDGLTRAAFWTDLMGARVAWDAVPLATVGLVVMVALVTLLYVVAMGIAARVVGGDRGELVEAFAYSLVPISLGYAVAHYFSLLVFDGQVLLALVSDPFRLGWDLFGTASRPIDFTVVAPDTIGGVQVAAIVFGHVAGVVLAHDRAVDRYSGELAGASQHPLLAAMVVYTVGGLALLLGG